MSANRQLCMQRSFGETELPTRALAASTLGRESLPVFLVRVVVPVPQISRTFLQYEQRRRLGENLVLASKLALTLLDSLGVRAA